MREDSDELDRFERGPGTEAGKGCRISNVCVDDIARVIGSEFKGEVDWVEMPEEEGEVGFEGVGVVGFSEGDAKVSERESGWEGSESGWSLDWGEAERETLI